MDDNLYRKGMQDRRSDLGDDYVDRVPKEVIITDLAVFTYQEGRLTLTELMPGATIDEVEQKTAPTFLNKL